MATTVMGFYYKGLYKQFCLSYSVLSIVALMGRSNLVSAYVSRPGMGCMGCNGEVTGLRQGSLL